MEQFLELSNYIERYFNIILFIGLGFASFVSLFKFDFRYYRFFIALFTPILMLFITVIIFITLILMFTTKDFLNYVYIGNFIICYIIIRIEIKKKLLLKMTRVLLVQSQNKYRYFILGNYIKIMFYVAVFYLLQYYKYI